MRKLFYIEDSIQNRVSYYHLLCFLVALPYDRFYSTVILVSFLMHTAIHLQKEYFKKINTETLLLQSVFFVTVAAASYAVSFGAAMNTVTKQLAVFLIPLAFNLNSLDLLKYRSRLLKGFTIGCTLTVVWLYIDAFRTMRYEKIPLKALFSQAFVNHNFSQPIDMHATYLSMLLAIALIFLVKRIMLGTQKKNHIVLSICSLVLAAGLIQLSSKSVLIALLLIFNIAFPWYLPGKKMRYRFLLVSVAMSSLLLLVILNIDVFRERYLVDFKKDLFKNTGILKDNWRRDRWIASVDLIKKAPIIGQGSGSEIPLLKEIYFERKMYNAYLKSLNAHNQYLSFIINSGIIGLIIYLGTLSWGFWKAIKRKDLLLLSFMLLVTIVSFSEDLLDVNKGIFFYAFFFSFFVLSKRKKADSMTDTGNQL